jgi:hypothetical protein
MSLRAFKINLDSVDRDVLGAFPEGFIFKYELLWLTAFGRSVTGLQRSETVGRSGAKRITRVSTSQVETRGGARKGKGSGKGGVDISDESALVMKGRVDRKLRAIARDIENFMNGQGRDVYGRRCAGKCKRFGDGQWSYCPNCGGRMEELD